jgi:proline dehydrogenase
MINKLIAWIIPFLPERFVWIFSKKYIAGKNFRDAARVVKQLNANGIVSTIDVLGEFLDNKEQAINFQKKYFSTIDKSAKSNLITSISVKPTMFGLLRDFDFCYETIREIIFRAKKHNYMVRIDMESSNCTDLELKLFEKLYLEFPANVGIVFQSYLKRTFSDLENLQNISIVDHPINIRLCKGIYIESANISFKKKKEINANFIKCLEFIFANRMYAAIATHDKSLIQNCLSLISQYKKNKDEYEFQMLWGVTPLLRNSIVNAGHTMRIYVPYGEHWFNYSTRRLKENPHLVRDIILGFFVRQ